MKKQLIKILKNLDAFAICWVLKGDKYSPEYCRNIIEASEHNLTSAIKCFKEAYREIK